MMIKKSGVRGHKSEVRRLRDIVFLATVFILFVFIGGTGDSFGFWPFTSPKKEVYIARVGDEIITKDEFLNKIDKLHKSSRVGRNLSEQTSFAMQDFGKFLNELIDNKLMIIEARNLGLDKEADFIMLMDNFALNLFLDKLRQEEILNKIKVEDKEIEDYYHEQLKKKEEEKKKAQEKADKERAEKEKTDSVKEDAKKDSDKKEDPPKMSADDREAIRRGFFNIKTKEREKEYFDKLRKKAKVKIDNEVLGALSRDKTELFGKDVANVNGESILGIDVLRELSSSKTQDEDAKKEILDKLVLYKLLDQEAMNRGYENDEQTKADIKKYKDPQLIEQFKKKAILPAVRVDENDILNYYKANQEKYRASDRVNLRIMHLTDEDEAKTILDDLKKGGDFSYLAREKSLDPSREKGGDIGWVETNQLSGDINKAIQGAKEGDILGPFSSEAGYAIMEFRGLEKGAYIPFGMVRSEIDTIVGRERFNGALNGYIKQLRETVAIEINQKELDKLQGK
ncbi:MAG: peptidylprolyl isomerase [Deltaproteobacteria bacterium]|nr:peptidylprolyl isomerase [Deltaproteobacteria bacterium]